MKVRLLGAVPLGVLIVVGGFFLVRSAHKNPEETLYEEGAINTHIPIADYRRIMDISGRVEQTHAVSDDDWEVIKSDLKTDNPKLRSLTLSCLCGLRYNNKHRDEAVKFAKGYLDANYPYGNVVAVIILYNLRDPDWKDRAIQIQSSTSNPEAKEEMARVLDKYSEKK